MPLRLEDYALIGDTETAALVGNNGSIDWLCLPRFDSGACFAALLGDARHGRWLLSPTSPVLSTRRRYRPETLVLETEFRTDSGVVRLTDFMPLHQSQPTVIRIVEGIEGRVPMRMELIIRFDYGSIMPWIRHHPRALHAVAGPDGLSLSSDLNTDGKGLSNVAEFAVFAGQRVSFSLNWDPSPTCSPSLADPYREAEQTEAYWRLWSSRCTYRGPWREAVIRSLLTLKALTYSRTGGIAAAPTTSLPEQIGGSRNWDYRYCWLRDATFTLYSLQLAGFTEEAKAWRDWLVRAAAGDPSDLQIMYGIAGERRLPEQTLPWLPGYERSAPVRIGNEAARQLQLDVYGEVMDAMHVARRSGLESSEDTWRLQDALMRFLEKEWRQPDHGIWEVRGPKRHFTHSKIMAWVALDRAIKEVEQFKMPGPVDRWKAIRNEIHAEVSSQGFDPVRGTFTQFYGSEELDAALLMIPLVGFLPPEDPRVRGTVEAIEQQLSHQGFILRYDPRTSRSVDGIGEGEGVFLPCSFWLADNYQLLGRHEDACRLFERLLQVRNDVGLLSEEYDPESQRLLGNFPQAFSHVALINTAFNLVSVEGPAQQRVHA
ncbi:MAG TPA: glycoside hydrolase family 15 protein [Planctomycetota bacterium]|jgi:GH15 family glucan-1,4-alpha-glucosidase|nr:glycoside hydrolase family 15 protein [Planctomycetota bacterium]